MSYTNSVPDNSDDQSEPLHSFELGPFSANMPHDHESLLLSEVGKAEVGKAEVPHDRDCWAPNACGLGVPPSTYN